MTLKVLARKMKYEAYQTGRATARLVSGIDLTLQPHGEGWKLTMTFPPGMSIKQPYKLISKAFFSHRVSHLSEPRENVLEVLSGATQIQIKKTDKPQPHTE